MTNYRHVQKLLTELRDDLGDGQENLAIKINQMKAQLRQLVPMDQILAKVPGDDVTDKCRYIGVSRTSYYYWLRGTYRPNKAQAKRLSNLTGFNVDEIRGNFRITPPR